MEKQNLTQKGSVFCRNRTPM